MRKKRESVKTCCSYIGLSGVIGLPGTDGLPGKNGLPGKSGKDYVISSITQQLEPKVLSNFFYIFFKQQWCYICNEEFPEPAGNAGPPGPKRPSKFLGNII